MAKNEVSLLNPLKTILSSKYIKVTYPLHTLLLFVSSFIFLTSILSGFKAIISNTPFMTNFITVLIALPLLLLFVYSWIHLFMSTFENHKKNFLEGYLIFSSYTLPIIALGHLLNLVQANSYNIVLNSVVAVLVIILFVTLLIITIRNSKTYFSTTYAKAISSIVLTAVIISLLTMLIFLSFLISTLQQAM